MQALKLIAAIIGALLIAVAVVGLVMAFMALSTVIGWVLFVGFIVAVIAAAIYEALNRRKRPPTG